MIAQTSLMAYQTIQSDATAEKQSAVIFSLFSENSDKSYTRNEVSRLTNIPINAVCGRISELLAQNLLVLGGKKRDIFTKKANQLLKRNNLFFGFCEKE